MSDPLSFPPASRRTVLGAVDPGELWELLENHFTDTGGEDGSPYRRQHEELLARFLEELGEETVNFAKLLDQVDAWSLVEAATRKAAFMVGFDCCRQLILGELDLKALKSGDAE